MSCIGVNIRKIRTVKKLSQAVFAELFGLARPSVGAWEEGRAEPKTDTLIQIAKHFGVSVDMLLTKELTVNDLLHFDIYQHQRQGKDLAESVSKVLPADLMPNVTPFVRADELLAYGMRCQDPRWLAMLPTLTMPPSFPPATRAFELSTSEMTQPTGTGLRPQDVVIGERVSLPTGANPGAFQLQPGLLYAVVLLSGPLVRRLQAVLPGSTLLLHADNPDYPPRETPLADVLELWQIRAVLTSPPAPPAPLDERVAKLEAMMAQLLPK
jgi:transcriptional regulator with XRE-family HTH domain